MRERIVGLTLLAAVLAIVAFGLPLAIGAARYYAVAERTDLSDDAEVAANTIESDLGAPSTPLPPATDVSPGSPTALYDVDGVLRSGDGPPRLDASLAGALAGRRTRATDGDDYLVALPIRDDDRLVAVLRAARPDSGVQERTGWTWAGMLVLAAAAVAVSRTVAGRLAGRMSGPLEDLAADAARIGEGDFTVRGRPSGLAEIDAVRGSLQGTAERLSDLLARERALATEASHQLRTPLTGLRLRLEEAATLPPERLGDALEGALAATDRLHRTVEDILRLARETRGTPTPLDVPALVAEAVAAQQPAPGRSVTRGRVGDDGVPHAAASAAAVRQILGVLLENALAHGAGAVTVDVRETGAAIAVDVADEGRMPEGADPFGHRPGATGASGPEEDGPDGAGADDDGGRHGIGLALARRLAEAEGGRLRLRSTDPTVFTLLLPAA